MYLLLRYISTLIPKEPDLSLLINATIVAELVTRPLC